MDDFQVERITRRFNTICQSIFNHYGSCDDCDSKICCTAYAPAIHRHEIDSIARHIGMKPKRFKKKFVINLNLPINNLALAKPCPLLSNKRNCPVYSCRPTSCRNYPFDVLILPELSLVFLEGIELCPISTIISEEIAEFYEKFSRPHLTTSKEFENVLCDTVSSMVSEIGDAWKEAKMETVESEFLAINPMSFFTFYMSSARRPLVLTGG